MSAELAGSSAAVIGGTSGIGLAVARLLVDLGASVTVGGRDASRGRDAAAEIGARYETIDATDPVSVARFTSSVVDASGAPTRLVLAGGTQGRESRRLGDTRPEQIAAVCQAQFASRMLPLMAFAPHMRGNGYGKVVAISTDAGRVPARTQWLAGSMASALLFAVRCLALELAPDGVRVNAVSLTLTKGTPVYQRYAAGELGEKVSNVLRKVEAAAPLGLPQINDVVSTIGFLLGPGSDSITGAIVSVNGGMSVPG